MSIRLLRDDYPHMRWLCVLRGPGIWTLGIFGRWFLCVEWGTP